jgi:hypothetical protein
MPSKVPALIDWLVTAFTASPALGAATPPVAVYDGPATTSANDKLLLWVGLQDPDNPGANEAATFEQARSDLGYSTRDEMSIIRCTAEAWGGMDVRTVRVAAFAIVAAAETIIRSESGPGAFGGLAQANPGVTGGVLLQGNPVEGMQARVTFDVIFRSFT